MQNRSDVLLEGSFWKILFLACEQWKPSVLSHAHRGQFHTDTLWRSCTYWGTKDWHFPQLHFHTVLYMNTSCMFLIWIRLKVNSSTVVMITSSVSSHQKSDVREEMCTGVDCVWAPSIDVVNTESTSPCPAVVLHSVDLEHTAIGCQTACYA